MVELSRPEAEPSGPRERVVIRPWLPTRVSLATRQGLAEPLGERDNDAIRPADVCWPVRILVLHLANELGTVGAMRATTAAMSSTANMTRRMPIVFTGAYTGPKPDRGGRVELVQLNALAIGSPHHPEGCPYILEPDQARERRPFRLSPRPRA